MNFERKYKKSFTEQLYMRFETSHPDGNNFDGVIMQTKPDFIVLREEKDFEFDGIVIIPKRLIKSIRDGKYEKCFNQILRHNGEIAKLAVPEWLAACDTLPKLLQQAQQNDIWIAVEIIFAKGAKSAFYLGPIIKINEEDFSINCYDATGKWEKEYELDYDEVFRIEFDSKYCNHFNAFMRDKDKA